MPEIIACEEHDQVYQVWRERKLSGLKVTHVDFHCDMRGLFINRPRGTAYFIGATNPSRRVDPGNFVAHAIMEGIVTSLRWVHGTYGGRRHDLGHVKYEGDLSAVPQRLLHLFRRNREAPIKFEELIFDDWDNNLDGQHLDIDWDAIAPIGCDVSHVRRLMDEFLARDFTTIPETTYLVYSPNYSHPNRSLFEEFLEKLAFRFSAEINRIPLPEGYPIVLPQDLVPSLKGRLILGLHRIGIY